MPIYRRPRGRVNPIPRRMADPMVPDERDPDKKVRLSQTFINPRGFRTHLRNWEEQPSTTPIIQPTVPDSPSTLEHPEQHDSYNSNPRG